MPKRPRDIIDDAGDLVNDIFERVRGVIDKAGRVRDAVPEILAHANEKLGEALSPNCSHVECDNAAIYDVVIMVPIEGTPPSRIWSGVRCCEDCRDMATEEAIITSEVWSDVCQMVDREKALRPDRKDLRVELGPLRSREVD